MAEKKFAIDSVVRGFHLYKDVWNPHIGDTLFCQQEFRNLHDPCACPLFVIV